MSSVTEKQIAPTGEGEQQRGLMPLGLFLFSFLKKQPTLPGRQEFGVHVMTLENEKQTK